MHSLVLVTLPGLLVASPDKEETVRRYSRPLTSCRAMFDITGWHFEEIRVWQRERERQMRCGALSPSSRSPWLDQRRANWSVSYGNPAICISWERGVKAFIYWNIFCLIGMLDFRSRYNNVYWSADQPAVDSSHFLVEWTIGSSPASLPWQPRREHATAVTLIGSHATNLIPHLLSFWLDPALINW